jgi:hypothetical protein
MFDLLFIALLCFAYAKGKRAIVAYQNRDQRWRDADAEQRERIVRYECAWSVLGRIVCASGLAIGASIMASPGLAVMWTLVALRVIVPITRDMRNACAYRSTGRSDEEPYSW